MPLYLIETKGSDAKRLIDATSETAAIKHAATGVFTARRISKPTEVASLVTGGAKVETAGEVPADDPPAIPDTAGIIAAANKAGEGRADGEEITADALFGRLVANKDVPDTAEARVAFVSALQAGAADQTLQWVPSDLTPPDAGKPPKAK